MALRTHGRLSAAASLLLLALVACSDNSAAGPNGGTGGVAGTGGSANGGAPGGSGGTGVGASGGVGAQGGAGGHGGAAGGAGGAGPEWGQLSGPCPEFGVTELTSQSAFYFDDSIDFGSQAYDYALLSTGGKKIYDDGNLGGSSIYSEVLSFEILHRCDLAELLKTETEIAYQDSGGKKTDLLVEIDGHRIGVSVTRAYAYPPDNPYTVAQAQALLDGKLSDILLSSANVAPVDAWDKQVLHVLAYSDQYAVSLAQAYALIDAATKADTIVDVTVTNGDDAIVYDN
jgi:hypothetical protein